MAGKHSRLLRKIIDEAQLYKRRCVISIPDGVVTLMHNNPRYYRILSCNIISVRAQYSENIHGFQYLYGLKTRKSVLYGILTGTLKYSRRMGVAEEIGTHGFLYGRDTSRRQYGIYADAWNIIAHRITWRLGAVQFMPIQGI